jgi:hypothetical protein|tara:strand:+ start:103 stop:288 length:186 start_codon:yes stop_codon:yes gene_type:complete
MSEPRIELKSCGRLGIWIYIDGKVIDLIHYSDLQKINGINQETIDAIEQIYDDIISEEVIE